MTRITGTEGLRYRGPFCFRNYRKNQYDWEGMIMGRVVPGWVGEEGRVWVTQNCV